MTDAQYAVRIYCRIFNVDTDDGEAYIRGILDAISTLNQRDQLALECNYRYGMKQAETAQHIGVNSANRARQIICCAVRKLCRYKHNMSVSGIIKERDEYKSELKNANRLAVLIQHNLPGDAELQALLDKVEVKVSDMGLSGRPFNNLDRAGKRTLASILSIATYSELIKIPKLGHASAAEIINRVREMGFHEWADRMEKESGVIGDPKTNNRHVDVDGMTPAY
jgi:hypothetical protein